MALTIDDLKPKNFKIKVKGVEIESKPPRLSHTLVISKVGETFKDIKSADRKQIEQAEKDFDWVVAELMPELKDIPLDMQAVIDIITELMEQVAPEENRELNEKGVKFNTDPKVGVIG